MKKIWCVAHYIFFFPLKNSIDLIIYGLAQCIHHKDHIIVEMYRRSNKQHKRKVLILEIVNITHILQEKSHQLDICWNLTKMKRKQR